MTRRLSVILQDNFLGAEKYKITPVRSNKLLNQVGSLRLYSHRLEYKVVPMQLQGFNRHEIMCGQCIGRELAIYGQTKGIRGHSQRTSG